MAQTSIFAFCGGFVGPFKVARTYPALLCLKNVSCATSMYVSDRVAAANSCLDVACLLYCQCVIMVFSLVGW